ncbi:hypothetical protein ACUUK2_001297 [Campylobacter coli]|nr:hypothetical protein [Campylobacter coli]EAH7662855.1 hypothetical protein [Campylobacter coli]EAI1254169.1 hypothetical protein [Campylobacter coli]EAI2055028.1 hypothetical protein [Campylobacter coli]EAJ5334742.1 hypothetical protein [Campylobacter coli]
MFDFFINYMIFCAKDLSKLFLGTLALFLFAFFGFMFFICEGVFLYVLLFCEIVGGKIKFPFGKIKLP